MRREDGMSLTRSKERVSDLGEVFTPSHIVDEMHSLLPKKNWSDKTMIYLEPTCGNGQFLVAAVQKKMDSGLTPEQAVNTTFGMDIMRDNIEDARLRVLAVVLDKVGKGNRKRLVRLASIIVNNIFKVKDSLAFMSGGSLFDEDMTAWEAKPFFDVDPTGHGMVLARGDRSDVVCQAKELIKKAGRK
jgi:hypothetical protein